ncbi:ISL3 family transposase [Halalkalibacterium halodurans]|uniref:ISL3 family transposase n=2 Tax=Halalkalibacterium halodurans TaxID=86665 RepID=UPI002E2277E4|nr:ISL3 family transposase [Halalkalibacterium halodurans]MED4126474.1 ISL3 family transposase [Halalkalibacterium halodurans]
MSLKFTRELIGLSSFDVKSIESIEGGWVATLTPALQSYICPLCCKPSTTHARVKDRRLKHLWIPERGILFVQVPVIRQRCNDCCHTWSLSWPQIPQRGKVTSTFRQLVVNLCYQKTFALVSKETGVAESTLSTWFYDWAPTQLPHPEDHQAPDYVCLDEFALRKGHQYGVCLQDHETGHVWKTGMGKKRGELQALLRSYPFSPPTAIVTDMAPGMAKTVKEVWSETAVVIDKFHVIQLLTQALDRARKHSMTYATQHLAIRQHKRLLMAPPATLKEEEREKLAHWFTHDWRLEELYQATQALRRVYHLPTYQQAKQAFQAWVNRYQFSPNSAVSKVVKTLIQWEEELLNYFHYKITNAKLEGTNNLIKTLKRRSYGTPCLEKMTVRIRLECQQPSKLYLAREKCIKRQAFLQPLNNTYSLHIVQKE